MTRDEHKKELRSKIAAIKQRRMELSQLMAERTDANFMQLVDEDKVLSVRLATAKFKLHNLEQGYPQLGNAMPEHGHLDGYATNGGKKPN